MAVSLLPTVRFSFRLGLSVFGRKVTPPCSFRDEVRPAGPPQEDAMPAVKFSVVIPTRERADTLRFALRTYLDQTFDDYEVIVSDNCSSPATKAAVDEVASPKV